jgi:phenylalanyl-tRNA synthetase beta chain
VHPDVAIEGLKRCLYWMSQWSGGQIAPGIVDNYPLPPKQSVVEITAKDIKRALGVEIPLTEAKSLLERLEFKCVIRYSEVDNSNHRISNNESSNIETLVVSPPPIRMDIGEGIVGVADVMEEIARLYGYDNIPETLMADPLPPQRGNPGLEAEERVRDMLAALGLQEIVTHRMTAPEIENRLLPSASVRDSVTESAISYVKLANPIAPEKRVLRRSLLSSVLNVVERNARLRDSLALFEIGSVYIPNGKELAPRTAPPVHRHHRTPLRKRLGY